MTIFNAFADHLFVSFTMAVCGLYTNGIDVLAILERYFPIVNISVCKIVALRKVLRASSTQELMSAPVQHTNKMCSLLVSWS